jgi:hypothetical protein
LGNRERRSWGTGRSAHRGGEQAAAAGIRGRTDRRLAMVAGSDFKEFRGPDEPPATRMAGRRAARRGRPLRVLGWLRLVLTAVEPGGGRNCRARRRLRAGDGGFREQGARGGSGRRSIYGGAAGRNRAGHGRSGRRRRPGLPAWHAMAMASGSDGPRRAWVLGRSGPGWTGRNRSWAEGNFVPRKRIQGARANFNIWLSSLHGSGR